MRMVHRSLAVSAVFAVAVSSFAATASAQRDSVLCYKVKSTLFEEKLPRGETARVEDALDPNNVLNLDPNAVPGENSTFGLKKVREVCIANDVDGAGVTDAASHFVWYDLKAEKGGCENDLAVPCTKDSDCEAVGGNCSLQEKFDKKSDRNRNLRVVDAYNDVHLDLGKELALLLPATVDGDAFLGLPERTEAYKCYDAKPTKKLCENGVNDGTICRRDDDCPGGACVKLPSFPKDTHPEGLEVNVDSDIANLFDTEPGRVLDVRKIKAYCQATDTKRAGQAVDPRDEEQAGMLCYAVKALKRECHGGDNDNRECRKDEDCPGELEPGIPAACRYEPKFDNRAPEALGYYVEDEVFPHRFDLRKEDLLCVPACKEPPATGTFSPHVLRLSSLQIPTSGHAFSVVAGLVNPTIASSVASGTINLLLEFDRFGDGNMDVNSYTGNLDPANAGCAVGNPAAHCSYLVDPEALDLNSFRTRTSCGNAGAIVVPVSVAGTATEPSAAFDGGNEDTGFRFAFPFTNTVTIELAARNVRLSGDLTHSGGQYTSVTNGTLTGVVVQRDFKATANELPDGLCQGGSNNNEPCDFSDALCPGGTCDPLSGTCAGGTRAGLGCGDDSSCPDPRTGNVSDACIETYVGGFTKSQVVGLIDLLPRDVDLDGATTCEGATNNGEPCMAISDCPDPNTGAGAQCTEFEGSSLILEFGGIDASISGVQP